MKATLKNPTTLAMITFTLIFLFALLATGSAQTIDNEPSVSMRYDGFDDLLNAPVTITKQRLIDDEIERNMYNYALPMNGKIGLPSMEDIHNNVMEEVMETILYYHTPLANLMDPDWDTTSNLIKFEGYDDTQACLIHPDWQ